MLEIQHRIEQQKIAPVRLTPPHRIIGEHKHVPFALLAIDHRRMPSERASTGQHTRNEKILLICEP
jgi:hypothetical protein